MAPALPQTAVNRSEAAVDRSGSAVDRLRRDQVARNAFPDYYMAVVDL